MQSASPVVHPRGRCKPTTSLPLALSLPLSHSALSPPRGSTMATTRPACPCRHRRSTWEEEQGQCGCKHEGGAADRPPRPLLLPILVGALEKAELLDPVVELLDPVTREAGDRAEAGGRRRRSGPALSACGLDSTPRARIWRCPFFPWRRRRAQMATSSDDALRVSARGAALLLPRLLLILLSVRGPEPPPQAWIQRLPPTPPSPLGDGDELGRCARSSGARASPCSFPGSSSSSVRAANYRKRCTRESVKPLQDILVCATGTSAYR
jgi:hypothetical protein